MSLEKRISKVISFVNEKVLNSNINEFKDESILSGKLSLGYYSYLVYLAEKDKRFLNKTQEILEHIFYYISIGRSEILKNITLANGLTGLGLLLYKLRKYLTDDYEDQLEIINELAFENCLKMIENERFDYFYGAIGLLFYLCELNKHGYCSRILDLLYTYSKKKDFLFYNDFEDPYVEGINFGLAHGSYSIVSVCLNLYQKDVNRSKAKAIATNTINSLFKFNRNKKSNINLLKGELSDYKSMYPYNVIKSDKEPFNINNKNNQYYYTNRLGWCNGDLSRSLIMYKAGILFDNHEIFNMAESLGKNSITRKIEKETVVRNFHFCHGSSGILHTYNNIFHLTKNEIFKNSIEYWKDVTLNFMERKIIKGNFLNQNLEILTGWLGGSLALYPCINNGISDWDRLFLINI